MEELLEKLQSLKNKNILIIVEGKNDAKALEYFGIKRILAIQGKALYEVIDNAENEKEVCILTDLDEEGKKLYGTLQHQLAQRGVVVDNTFRHFLFKKTKLRHIEGLITYVKHHELLTFKNIQV